MSNLSLNLPSELIERAVRDKINAAIAAQLGDPEVLIGRLVSAALSQKVNCEGVKDTSSYRNEYDFLDVVVGEFIRDAAKLALKEYLTENEKIIKDCVKKEIAKSPSKMAKVFMDGLMDSMTCAYRSNVSIEFKTIKDD